MPVLLLDHLAEQLIPAEGELAIEECNPVLAGQRLRRVFEISDFAGHHGDGVLVGEHADASRHGEFALGEFVEPLPKLDPELDDVVPRAHDEDVIATGVDDRGLAGPRRVIAGDRAQFRACQHVVDVLPEEQRQHPGERGRAANRVELAVALLHEAVRECLAQVIDVKAQNPGRAIPLARFT